MIEGRLLVAKNRTRAFITVGGLNIRDTTLKAECLYADSDVRHLWRYYNGNAPRLIKRYLRDLLAEDLLLVGSLRMLAIGRKQTDFAPIYTDANLKMATILKKCEESQDTWEDSTISRLVYDKPFPITAEEKWILTEIRLTTVSQLFDLE